MLENVCTPSLYSNNVWYAKPSQKGQIEVNIVVKYQKLASVSTKLQVFIIDLRFQAIHMFTIEIFVGS